MLLPRLPQVSEGEASAHGHLLGTTLCPHPPGLGVEWGAETQPLVKGPQPGSAPGKRRRKPLVECPAETPRSAHTPGHFWDPTGPHPQQDGPSLPGGCTARGGLRWPQAPWGGLSRGPSPTPLSPPRDTAGSQGGSLWPDPRPRRWRAHARACERRGPDTGWAQLPGTRGTLSILWPGSERQGSPLRPLKVGKRRRQGAWLGAEQRGAGVQVPGHSLGLVQARPLSLVWRASAVGRRGRTESVPPCVSCRSCSPPGPSLS